MLFIVITMIVILGVAGLVVAFVAFPHRGEDLPGASWLGESLGKAVNALPTISDGDLDGDHDGEHDREREPGLHL